MEAIITSSEMSEAERLLIQKRKAWLERLKLDFKEETLFELEILLKAMDRFFNINNLPLANIEQVVTENFHEELSIVHEFVDRIIKLIRKLLEASKREDYHFRQYVEVGLLSDYARTRHRLASLDQKSPEDSLVTLYSTFVNIQSLISGLVQLNEISYQLYFNLGSLISREIATNRYFNPMDTISFRPEYDRVGHKRIARIVKSIPDPEIRKNFSIVVLAFFRLLHYTDFINPDNHHLERLRDSLLFFALINSESKHLTDFMEKNLPEDLADNDNPDSERLISLCDSLAFQLSMELKKINQTELVGASKQPKVDSLRCSVENSKGILSNFFQQSIVQLMQLMSPELKGEDIFVSFISRRWQSLRLREDVWVFRNLMDKFEEITETSINGASLQTYVKYLKLQKSYIAYLKREIVPLLRYSDLIEFNTYFSYIDALTDDDLHLMDKLDSFKMESKFFKIFVETTVSHINNRAEIQETPLDEKACENRLKNFIGEEMGRPG
jgi:hypothetical protein